MIGINIKNLKEFLREYLPAMNETIPTTINRGGCGIFATEFSKTLTSMGVENKIKVTMRHDGEMWYNLHKYSRGMEVPVHDLGVSHVIVEMDGNFYDAMGDFSPDVASEFDIELTADQLEYFLNNDNWNEDFDSSCSPQIVDYLRSIPAVFSNWTKGDFKPSIRHESEKPLNTYTEKRLSKFRSFFDYFNDNNDDSFLISVSL